nr:hypothetical protein Iba_scaffold16055CG0040 [Ipomoea batatas]
MISGIRWIHAGGAPFAAARSTAQVLALALNIVRLRLGNPIRVEAPVGCIMGMRNPILVRIWVAAHDVVGLGNPILRLSVENGAHGSINLKHKRTHKLRAMMTMASRSKTLDRCSGTYDTSPTLLSG